MVKIIITVKLFNIIRYINNFFVDPNRLEILLTL